MKFKDSCGKVIAPQQRASLMVLLCLLLTDLHAYRRCLWVFICLEVVSNSKIQPELQRTRSPVTDGVARSEPWGHILKASHYKELLLGAESGKKS